MMIPNYLKKEFNILFYAVRKKHTTLIEMANTLCISKRTVKEDIIKINNSFKEYLSIEEFLISNNSGVICVNPEYRYCAIECAYHIKLKLLQGNMLFSFCVQLITHAQISKKEMLKKLYVSEQYLARLIQQLNDYFKKYDIVIVNNGGIISLSGHELSVRIFSYIFLQDAYQEIEWPFDDLDMNDIRDKIPIEILNDTYKRSKTKLRALYILCGILQTRVNGKKFIEPSNSSILVEFFELISKKANVALIFHRKLFDLIDEENKKNEVLYFNFLARVFIPHFFSHDQKIEEGDIFFNSPHPYCVLSKKIYRKIVDFLNEKTSKDNLALCMYYITIFNVWYFLVEDKYLDFLDIYLPKMDFHVPNNNESYMLIHKSINMMIERNTHSDLISNMIYWFSVSEKESTIEIYLQMIKDFSAEFFIKNRLSFLYNENTISITDDYSAADIVITDTYETSAKDKDIFYLNSIEDEESWSELTELIQRIYFEKLNYF